MDINAANMSMMDSLFLAAVILQGNFYKNTIIEAHLDEKRYDLKTKLIVIRISSYTTDYMINKFTQYCSLKQKGILAFTVLAL